VKCFPGRLKCQAIPRWQGSVKLAVVKVGLM
jgi:hypothetical protein